MQKQAIYKSSSADIQVGDDDVAEEAMVKDKSVKGLLWILWYLRLSWNAYRATVADLLIGLHGTCNLAFASKRLIGPIKRTCSSGVPMQKANANHTAHLKMGIKRLRPITVGLVVMIAVQQEPKTMALQSNTDQYR